MTLRHGLFVSGSSAGVTAPQDGRLSLAGLLSGPGVLNGGVVSGSTSGPNMKYTVTAGVFVTQRGTLATDGLYMVPNDGPVTVDSGSPAPSSGTRWDLVWVRQPNAYGSDGFGDANSDPVFGVTVGTAGSTPTKPYASVPAGALVLAESNVGTNIANASLATITNVAAVAFVGDAMGFLGEQINGATATLASAGGIFAGAAFVVTLPVAQRVRVSVGAYFRNNVAGGGASGVYTIRAAYNTGAGVTTPVPITPGNGPVMDLAAGGLRSALFTEATVLLAAGTYTFYALGERNSGGGNTDQMISPECHVYGVGAS